MNFYGKEFKHSTTLPDVTDAQVKLFSKGVTMETMISIMERAGVEVPSGLDRNRLSKIYTQFHFLRSNENWRNIVDG